MAQRKETPTPPPEPPPQGPTGHYAVAIFTLKEDAKSVSGS